MNNVILFFCIKYKGNWEKIYFAIANKEPITFDDINKNLINYKDKFITILSSSYPDDLKNIYKPPFIFFVDGNKNLLNAPNKITLIDKNIDKEHLLSFKNNFHNYVFVVSYKNKTLINLLMEHNLKFLVILDKSIDEFRKSKNYQRIIESKNAIITEIPNNSKQHSTESYFVRLLVGVSSKILFTKKINENFQNILEVANREKIPIFSMTSRNACGFNINRIKNLWEIKSNEKKH